MEYAQLNPILTQATQITTQGNVAWDATHFCPVNKLTDAEMITFRIVPLTPTVMPVFDPITHTCIRDGCEKVNNVWQYKWLLEAVSSEQSEANLRAYKAILLDTYVVAITEHLDSIAQTRNYDNRITCSVRAAYPGPYQAEGIAFGSWMDTCNAAGYQMLADYQAGLISQPTVEELIAGLPEMVWPT